MSFEDKFWCLLTGHDWYLSGGFPVFVTKNGMAMIEYTKTIPICLSCGKQKNGDVGHE